MSVLVQVALAFTSEAGCAKAARMMQPCPHVTAVLVELAGAGLPRVRLHFTLPRAKVGWALALARQPELIGAVAGTAVITGEDTSECESGGGGAAGDGMHAPGAAPSPPCGTECTKCPHYLVRCGGCPATPLFRPGYIFK